MHSQPQKNDRATQARINGAKSRGPKTAHGKERARTAPRKHGLYAADANLLFAVDAPAYAELREKYLQIWQPANAYMADKVEDLIAVRWELNRLRAVRREHLARVFASVSCTAGEDVSIVCETEIQACTPGGTLDRFDYRIRRCSLEISRIERDLLRLARHFSPGEASQNSLKTKEEEPEGTQGGPELAWAEETFDLELDAHQAEILTATDPQTLLCAARYSGKTTALALRAIRESEQNPDARIVCLSPNADLKAKVHELAGHPPANIQYAPHPKATLVLVDDAADLPGIPPTGKAQLILAATPNGASGDFFERWHGGQGHRIYAPDRRCDVIPEDLLAHAREQLSEAAYLQEFRCEFLARPQPRCNLLPLAE